MIINRDLQKSRRKKRVRSKARGTKEMPRLSVFRSNNYIYVQLIDDGAQKILLGVSEKHLDKKVGNKIDHAKALGLFLAKKAEMKKITTVVFDRGSYRYHGRIKAFAEGVREGGLRF